MYKWLLYLLIKKEVAVKTLNKHEVKELTTVEHGESFEIPQTISLDHDVEVKGCLVIHNVIAGSSVDAYVGSIVDAYDGSRVYAYDGSRVYAYDGSRVYAYDGSRVDAYDGSRVDAYGGSRVDAYGGVIYIKSDGCAIRAAGNTVIISNGYNADIKMVGNAIIQNNKNGLGFFERNYIEITNKSFILYKRVSVDFKTQEETNNETLWGVGTTVSHPNWHPEDEECGSGKFHGVAKPFFADEFRDKQDDRYVAILVNLDDVYEWERPSCPHKIAFREGKVLYECDAWGDKI